MADGKILKPSRPLGTPDYLIWERKVITKEEHKNASDYSFVILITFLLKFTLGCSSRRQ